MMPGWFPQLLGNLRQEGDKFKVSQGYWVNLKHGRTKQPSKTHPPRVSALKTQGIKNLKFLTA